jgi:hypothetical protein
MKIYTAEAHKIINSGGIVRIDSMIENVYIFKRKDGVIVDTDGEEYDFQFVGATATFYQATKQELVMHQAEAHCNKLESVTKEVREWIAEVKG